jgi:hypothetical protein
LPNEIEILSITDRIWIYYDWITNHLGCFFG